MFMFYLIIPIVFLVIAISIIATFIRIFKHTKNRIKSAFHAAIRPRLEIKSEKADKIDEVKEVDEDIICDYCGSYNSPKEKNCTACGAKLTKKK